MLPSPRKPLVVVSYSEAAIVCIQPSSERKERAPEGQRQQNKKSCERREKNTEKERINKGKRKDRTL
ncbi:hypothetical protein Y1Q_0008634 [Alligator mississippiensis]|uniref:Uncharacterized protein n=1 Tax=Alligator mississippiensis TaxID=8496 RepID=A0A151N9A2_ALLMI|nr:hypothetical protein Y1Q_0008634 [Alligator mississippiensis]